MSVCNYFTKVLTRWQQGCVLNSVDIFSAKRVYTLFFYEWFDFDMWNKVVISNKCLKIYFDDNYIWQGRVNSYMDVTLYRHRINEII